jgi:hypothetical protein
MALDRRESDRDTDKRLAVVEVQMLQIGVSLNKIERDIHAIADSSKTGDKDLEKRVSELEKAYIQASSKVSGGWFVATVLAGMFIALIGIYLKITN